MASRERLGEVMKTIIHINQHVIRSNTKTGAMEPPITVKTHKGATRHSGVVIKDISGNEVARLVYSPDKPLACGAKVWIEVDSDFVEAVA
jgi:hypothetical protein